MDKHDLYEGVEVPLDLLRVALNCASHDKDRPDICGVYIHRVGDEIRIAATDKARGLVASHPLNGTRPEWLEEGLILPRDGLSRPLGYLASVKMPEGEPVMATIGYLAGAARATLGSEVEGCTFSVKPVNATYPDYARLYDQLNVFEGRDIPDMHSVAFWPTALRGVAEIAKMLGKEVNQVRLHGAHNDEEPSLVTFPDRPEIVMFLLPMTQKQKELAPPTIKLLAGPLGNSISQLKSHRTRWQQKAEKAKQARPKTEALAKVAEYDVRIAALEVGVLPALPAPGVSRETSVNITVETAEERLEAAE